jgi:hypothetical protein
VAELNPSNGILAKGIDNLPELIPLGEIQIYPVPYFRVLTVAQINFPALKVA